LASVIESGRLIRPGTPASVKIDVRVIAASSLPLDRAASENMIIPELLRQFGTREVRVPPLRERKEELPLLARQYMHQLSRQLGLAPKEFSVATEEAWQSHQWPGNLRELKQVVKRYLIAGETALETEGPAQDQRSNPLQTAQNDSPSANASRVPSIQPVVDIAGYKSLRSMLRSVKEEAERAAILSALEKTGWNRKAAARLLKVSYRSILYKIEEYQMNLPDRSTSWASHQIPHGTQSNGRGDQKRAMDIILEGVVRSTS
jgi:two-component system response regulator AtoC